jgi:SMODS and SLOG-associating 2TM effector domain family 4
VTTGGFLSAFLGSGVIGAAIGVLVSTALLVLNAYTKDYDLGELAQKHKQAANDIWLIREKYLSLLTNLAMGDTSLEAVRAERDKLLTELHAVYAGSPSTTYTAYKKAQQALQRDEDMTFSDQEIDAFLPNELKRSL